MTKQFNSPNYLAYVSVYAPGNPEPLVSYWIQQVSGRGRKALERVNGQVVETVEGLRDSTGLEYLILVPTEHSRPDYRQGHRRVWVK